MKFTLPLLLSLAAVFAGAAFVGPATAGPPDAAMSTVSDFMVGWSDIPFEVVVRDINGSPVENAIVVLDFSKAILLGANYRLSTNQDPPVVVQCDPAVLGAANRFEWTGVL